MEAESVWRTDQHNTSAGEFHCSASFTPAMRASRCLDGVDLPGVIDLCIGDRGDHQIYRHNPYQRLTLTTSFCSLGSTCPYILGTFDIKSAAKIDTPFKLFIVSFPCPIRTR